MAEKLSERPAREAKVKSLKDKLLTEIAERITNTLVFVKDAYSEEDDPSKWEEDIHELHLLYFLRSFLKEEHTLMEVEAEYADNDTVVYTVSEDTIDAYIHTDSALTNILFAMDRTGRGTISPLSDRFFEYGAFTVFDRVIWNDQKKKKEKTK